MTNNSTWELQQKRCLPCEGDMPPLAEGDVAALLSKVDGWSVEDQELVRTFSFKNYYQTSAFVNAVVWIAHREDHHPDITFGYKTCTIRYSTHAVGGLTENDFICAAKINAIMNQG